MPKFKKLYEIQYCYICHAPLNAKNYTIDHEPPRGRGGASAQLPCCDKCNHDKGMLTAKHEYVVSTIVMDKVISSGKSLTSAPPPYSTHPLK